MDNQPLGQSAPQNFGNDYLNQIAVKPKAKSGLFGNKMILVLGGVLVLAVVLLFVSIIGRSGQSPKQSSEVLYLRMANLQSTASKYQKYLKSSKLRAINTSFMTQMTNTQREFSTQMTTLEIKPDKISKETKQIEIDYIAKVNSSLENARLNVALDRNYAREMTYQIDLVLSQMQKIEKTAKQDFKTALAEMQKNLKPYSEQFNKFSDS
jgi:hypothetical protein